MVKAKKITMYEVKCPNSECGRMILTGKEFDIQCRGCGKKFDLT